MITFNRLGKYGRLGNQLFQISAVISYSIDNNKEYGFPEWEYNSYLKTPLPFFSIKPNNEFKERGAFTFTKIPPYNDLDLNGYFQNELYFKNNRDYILNRFTLKEEIQDKIKDESVKWGTTKTTAIHIRRGDYLNLSDHHPVLDYSYYKEASDFVAENTELFIVFSDDIEWCKNNFSLDKKCYFQKSSNPLFDLFLMAECNNHIIANSSFSWWGSYLSKNDGKCFAPIKWLGPAYKGVDFSGIYREKMIKL